VLVVVHLKLQTSVPHSRQPSSVRITVSLVEILSNKILIIFAVEVLIITVV